MTTRKASEKIPVICPYCGEEQDVLPLDKGSDKPGAAWCKNGGCRRLITTWVRIRGATDDNRKPTNPGGVTEVKPSRLTPVKLRLHLEVDVVVAQLVWEKLKERQAQGKDYKTLLLLSNRSGQRWPLTEIEGLAEVFIIGSSR